MTRPIDREPFDRERTLFTDLHEQLDLALGRGEAGQQEYWARNRGEYSVQPTISSSVDTAMTKTGLIDPQHVL